MRVSYTKKGPGRVNSKSFRKTTSKLARKQVRHTVSLKNARISLVQSSFDERVKERFLCIHK